MLETREASNKLKPYMGHIRSSKSRLVNQASIYESIFSPTVQPKGFIKCSNDLLLRDSFHVSKNEDSPRKLISQCKRSTKSDNTKFETISVFVTRTISLEEQLQELQRKLVEKDAEIERLIIQLAKQASISKQKGVDKIMILMEGKIIFVLSNIKLLL